MIFGMPNPTLSAAWPNICVFLNVGVEKLGLLMTIYLFFNVVMLTLSSKMIEKIGARNSSAIGLIILGAAVLMFSIVKSFLLYIVAVSIMGFASGIIDTSVDYYVAFHYKPRLLAWLHCFWAVGSAIGPFILSKVLSNGQSFQFAFKIMFPIYIIVPIITLFFTNKNRLILYKNTSKVEIVNEKSKANFIEILKIDNAWLYFLSLLLSDFLLNGVSIWYSTYVTAGFGVAIDAAAKMVSIFFVGATLSRIVAGIIVEWLGTIKMMFLSFIIFLFTSILFIFSNGNITILYICSFLFGFGIAPCYPLFVDIAKKIFGKDKLHAVIGIGGSSAQLGSFFASVFISLIIKAISVYAFVYVIFIVTILALLSFYILYKRTIKLTTRAI